MYVGISLYGVLAYLWSFVDGSDGVEVGFAHSIFESCKSPNNTLFNIMKCQVWNEQHLFQESISTYLSL